LPLIVVTQTVTILRMVNVRRLVWDPGNVAHIARHGLSPDQVEEVCQGTPIVRQAYDGRLMVIGPTRHGRMLAIVLDPEPSETGVYYPVMARAASRKERRAYQEGRGGEQR
jgi:uncharacterized DUF497 family protein